MGFTQVPAVSIGGHVEVYGSLPAQDANYAGDTLNGLKNRATNDASLAGDATLLFKISGINDYAFKYGAVLELNANSTYSSWNDNLNSNKACIYGESFWGKVEVGATIGTTQKLKIDASTFARAAGGISGKYLNFINLPYNATVSPLFILIPQHPTGHGGYAMGFNNMLYICDANGNAIIDAGAEKTCADQYSNDNYRLRFQEIQTAMKVSYYTPEILGFQLGVSYTPDTGNRGTAGFSSSRLDTGDLNDVVEYGAIYSNTFYGIGFSASCTGEYGTSESKANNVIFRQKLQSAQCGANLSFYGLVGGASIGKWGNSLAYKNTKTNGQYTTIGLGYEFGPANVSVTRFDSEFDNNEYSATSVGVDYKVAKGFLPYVEYTNFKFNPSDKTVVANKGNVVLAGFALDF